MREFKITDPSVPPDTYRALFRGVQDSFHLEYGAGLRFEFEITDGPFAGRKVWRTMSATPTPRNTAGKLLGGLLGRPLQNEEAITIDDLVGREYLALVEQTASGSSRVAAVFPLQDN